MSVSASATVFDSRPTLADARFGSDPMNAVWHLAAQSPVHRKWALSEIERLFLPALETNQCTVYWSYGLPVGVATWMELPLTVIEQFVAGEFRLEPRHWTGHAFWPVHNTLHVLIVDMIALDDTCHAIVHDLRRKFTGQTCFALRRNHGKRRLALFRGYDNDVAIHAA
jgi:hemolysin-activating ACP:hemolysin acyltransferase